MARSTTDSIVNLVLLGAVGLGAVYIIQNWSAISAQLGKATAGTAALPATQPAAAATSSATPNWLQDAMNNFGLSVAGVVRGLLSPELSVSSLTGQPASVTASRKTAETPYNPAAYHGAR